MRASHGLALFFPSCVSRSIQRIFRAQRLGDAYQTLQRGALFSKNRGRSRNYYALRESGRAELTGVATVSTQARRSNTEAALSPRQRRTTWKNHQIPSRTPAQQNNCSSVARSVQLRGALLTDVCAHRTPNTAHCTPRTRSPRAPSAKYNFRLSLPRSDHEM